ncbi:hypothetical protein Taro_023181, partial [Colocasia esculenta]|nr:hypothetical protein [Colocasia esculenta]
MPSMVLKAVNTSHSIHIAIPGTRKLAITRCFSRSTRDPHSKNTPNRDPRARIAQHPTSKTSPGRAELVEALFCQDFLKTQLGWECDISLRRDQVATRLPIVIHLSTSARLSRAQHAVRMQTTSQNSGNQNAASLGVAIRRRRAPLS